MQISILNNMVLTVSDVGLH